MENKERQDFAPPASIAGGEVPVYEGTIEKPNVVVVGNSGVGKSTLINSLFQTYVAETSIGEATTKELRVYETDALSFRIIDTIGFEPGVVPLGPFLFPSLLILSPYILYSPESTTCSGCCPSFPADGLFNLPGFLSPFDFNFP